MSSTYPLYLYGLVLVGIGVVGFIVLAKDPSPGKGSALEPVRPTANSHVLSFTVGEHEKHTVVYSFDQMWGWLTITVDGVLVVKTLVTFSFRLVSRFDFQVGQAEVHAVRVEKHRALFFSFARPQPIKAFVDGVLVAEADGSRNARQR
jgi:hypothetical protein